MRARRLLSLALLAMVLPALIGAAPTMAQEQTLGFFEGQIGGGNAGSGAIAVRGWALADSGVKKVVIRVDGEDFGQAVYARARPDVQDEHPGFPDSPAAGFAFRLNSTRFENGLHTVAVRVFTNAGKIFDLPQEYTYQFNNNPALNKPFGAINHPAQNATLFGTCDLRDPRRRYAVIDGWALDLGVQASDAGINSVELVLDGSPIADTRVSCTFLHDAGGLTNCYGLPRFDIERLYPFAINAPNAGFRFAIDVGVLVNFGWVRGSHTLKIRADDRSNQIDDIDEVQVVFACIEDLPNEPSFGEIERPRSGRTYQGNVPVRGWALDWEGVRQVHVLVDGIEVDRADFGVGGRPNVANQYPGFPDSVAPAFRLRPNLDGTQYSDGPHQLQVRVVDDEGDSTLIGEVVFNVDNDPEN